MHHRHSRCDHDLRFARREHRHEDPQFGHRRHGHGSRSAGLGRFFAQGDLRLVILHLIAERPRHGYEIIKEIEDQVGGAYSPSPGVIYPTLTLLEELGYMRRSLQAMERRSYMRSPPKAGLISMPIARPWRHSLPACRRPAASMVAVLRRRSFARWRT
jgi:PadR family transcriptional regulator